VNKYDPRTLFFTTFIYILLLAMMRKYIDIVVLLLFLIGHILLFSIKRENLKRVLKYSITLFLSIIFINYFLIGRDLEYIVVGVFRFLGIIFIAVSLVSSIDIDEIGFVMESFLSPLKIFKIPVDSIAVITALGLKFIPLLQEEGQRIYLAQKARGLDFELMGIGERVKSVINLFFPVVVSGIQKAFHIATAMEVRGYGNGMKRSRLKEYNLNKKDYLYMGFTVILLIVRVGIIVK
jgi:energy-coupling factor transport system permease protein